ncbi:PIG-L family deacetylase [bacterium]|nr:PIG-L family deacetylase [bacterium]
MINEWNRILVFGAHPDDEIIGVGGTIARLSRMGKEVYVVTFTAGETGYSRPEEKDIIANTRLREAQACDKILGIKERVVLGRPTQGVVNDRETYQECVRLIRKYKPDVIFTHWNRDKHRDHRAVSEVTEEAWWKAQENVLADMGAPWRAKELYFYEINELFTFPSLLIDISDTLEFKLKAMETQVSQMDVLPNIMRYIEALAQVRGYLRGTRYAEAFLLSSFLGRLD